MNKARLIKRKELIEREQAAQKPAPVSFAAKVKIDTVTELIEREQAAQKPAPVSFAAKVKIDTVADWVKRHRAYRQPNARVMFAALFAHPKTS